jgi:cysteinyl-tRNA synthetase
MDDDFNTPEAFSVMFEMVKEINKHKFKDQAYANQLGALLVRLGESLGLLQNEPSEFLRSGVSIEVDSKEIERMLAAREQARADKDWQRADEIRDKLTAMKVVVEDNAEGSSWRIER